MCNVNIKLFPHERFNTEKRLLNIHVLESFATLNVLEFNIVCKMLLLTSHYPLLH